jgi:superfamily II DNA/RNA helicase
MQLMGMSDYLQRIGRAGRSEFGGNKVEPKSYLVTDGDEKQLHHAKLLLKEKVLKKRVTFKPDPDDLAYFAKWEAFDRMLLCRIISGEPQDENSSVVNSVKMLTLGKSLKISFAKTLFTIH